MSQPTTLNLSLRLNRLRRLEHRPARRAGSRIRAANRAFASLVVAILWIVTAPAVASDGDAAAWLERMSGAMSQMSYQGTFVYVQGDDVETMRITHVANERGVQERLVSVSGSRREVIRDSGGIVWFQGDQNAVMEDAATSRSFFPEISMPLANPDSSPYQVKLGNRERIAGHSGQQIRIMPLDEYRYGYSLWLEENSALLLKWELTDNKQRRLAKLMFTDLRLGSEVDTRELKSAEKEKNYQKLESGLPSSGNLSHSNPKWKATRLPAGFELTSHRYLGTDDEQLYEHLVYSDGLAAVSVYVESADDEPADPKPTLSRLGTAHAYSRVTDGALITVIGDVPAITVQSIGDAVRPKAP